MQARTDLALEIKEQCEEENQSLEGVRIQEHFSCRKRVHITTVTIENEKGEHLMQRKRGTYITMEVPEIQDGDTSLQEAVVKSLIACIRETKIWDRDKILLVGLGNREITSDSLGPRTITNTLVNRHLTIIKKQDAKYSISAIIPGVMAQTGMESLEIVRGIIKETKPGLVIVVDALAARSIYRVNTTIQISDTGIAPGSGLGNYRLHLSEETLGVPVLAIGVPTVVSAATIVRDLFFQVQRVEPAMETCLKSLSEQALFDRYENMFVTTKNVDEEIICLSRIISHAIEECYDITEGLALS